ncbi:glycosyltransferase family 2 protein [Pseudoalteromonas aurantia]|uniref:Glycosyltransferase 2-like domain-containing protein n=1 Tax=Pseudoalteromonas aurantia 208 TaxID=1314867 RepID=A0ABR9EE65_9GAMM|nr:glycosyltransferase family 2 protein [Pseudoalteromonas aurantia]MBE0369282.1 hypothetical protein [Pseudoalteromonas aurantia 208]
MKISVVIPLFNKAKFISRALESISAQVKKPLEIIVVNDGSTDESASIVRSFSKCDVRFINHDKNLGVSCARNSGISAALGDFIAFLDADDYWQPNFLEVIEELYEQYPNGKVFFTSYHFYDGRTLTPAKHAHLPSVKGEVKNYFLSCCNADLPITASSVCIEASILKTVGMFPKGLMLGEDQTVWGKLACITKMYCSADKAAVYDLNASKPCSLEHVELSPHIYYFDSLAKDDSTPEHLVPSINYLLHLSVMSYVRKNLMNGNKRTALITLKSNRYLIWDKYRVIAFLLLLLPKSLVSRFFRYARTFR